MVASEKRVAPCISGVLFLSLLALAACSGGGGSSATPSLPGQVPQPIQNSGQTPPPVGATSPPVPVGATSSVRIYATNFRLDLISVYDEEGHPVANCPFADLLGPLGIAFDSHNSRLYVSSAPHLKVFDLNGNPVATAGSFPGSLENVAVDTNNHLIYTISRGGPGPTMGAVFDEEGNRVTVTGTFPGPDQAIHPTAGVAFDPFNRHLYGISTVPFFGVPQPGELFVWDEQGNGVQLPNASIGYGCGANVAITFDPHNRLFYVISTDGTVSGICSSAVTAFDESGKTVPTKGTFPAVAGGGFAIAFDANNNRLYIEGERGVITVYDEQGNQITTSGTFPRPNSEGGSALVAAPQ